MLPEVSVIMSVYNGQEYLKDAIESILTQSFTNFEFIIIDDGSTDKSFEIINEYKDHRIKLVQQHNTGLAIALNRAIRLSNTPLIARMDADDIAMQERLETQIAFLKRNPDHVLIGSNAIIIDMNGEVVYSSRLPDKWEAIKSVFPASSFYHSSVIFTKEAFNKSGGYYEEISKLYSFEDSILWNKMKEFGKMANISTPLIKYRLIPSAATAKSGKETKLANAVFKDIIREGFLSDKNRERLLKSKNSISKNDRLFGYYFHLAKKYLWNTTKTEKVRDNLKYAIKIKPNKFSPYFSYLLSFLPHRVILLCYTNLQKLISKVY
jgi:glycosyltransferase involved in cell wall biosynthesis